MKNGLKLSRKKNEKVVITTPEGRLIGITVSRVTTNGAVELNFEADLAVEILRSEVWERRQSNRPLV